MRPLLLPAPALLFALVAVTTALAGGGHDSLAYDADASFLLFKGKCTVKVIGVTGSARGLVATPELVKTCGTIEPTIKYEIRQLRYGDLVSTDEFVWTDNGGSVALELADGHVVVVSGKSEVGLNGACDPKQRSLEITYGTAKVLPWSSSPTPPAPPGSPQPTSGPPPPPPGPPGPPPPPPPPLSEPTIRTSNLTATPTGTSYSVDAGPQGGTSPHVVRVYEGSVDVIPRTDAVQKEIGDIGAQAAALNDKLAKGEITQGEFTRRIMALSAPIEKKTKEITAHIVVGAGYECTVDSRGKVSRPRKFK